MTIRIMKAFQIQANYQKHKQRLTSINDFNIKKKVTTKTFKNMQLINNFKKNRCTAQIFNQKQKSDFIANSNLRIQKSLTRVYNRESKAPPINKKVVSMQRFSSRSSIHSANSSTSRIRQQNLKLVRKIETTKSQYSKFRETSTSKVSATKRQNNQSYRDQLIRLLQAQLGTKPQVLFPDVKTKRKQYLNKKQTSNSSKSLHKRSTTSAHINSSKIKK